jgi:hypothetical protein
MDKLRIKIDDNTQIYTMYAQSYLLNDQGLYGCGYNYSGVLGEKNIGEYVLEFTKMI